MDKLERSQIRTEYCKENGYVWIKPENTEMNGYIEYLEDKLIAQQQVKKSVDLDGVSNAFCRNCGEKTKTVEVKCCAECNSLK